MADLQQLERSFLQAHKAGDKKAAGVLAAEIKRQRASGSSGAPAADAPVSGLKDQFSAGFESNVELPGLTVETLGKTAQDKDLEATGKWLRDLTEQPKNFVSAADRFINPKPGDSYVDPIAGFGWGNAPGAAAEVGGQFAGDMMARTGVSAVSGAAGALGGFVAGGPVGAGAGFAGGAVGGALAGPAVLEFMRVAGPVAIERAKNNGREVPTWEDWQAAAATAGLAGALNAIGIKGIGKLNAGVGAVGKKTATEVVKEGAKETGKKALTEGVTEAGQSVVQQAGETAFTDKGLQIDLKQAVGEGILGTGAGGVIDAGRNIRPTVRTALDVRSVDSAMRNNPDAQTKAELTRDVNDIAGRMEGSGKEPLSQELNRYTSDLKRQIKEAIDGQQLDPEDKKALKGGMQDATGLTQDRLDEIAGRSENPSEIKALARKIQVIRETTMQKQTAKGFRGAAAWTAESMGPYAGGAIGAAIGGEPAAVIGAAQGAALGKSIARNLRGNQTQGNAIDRLIGAKQARRAAMLLDRYGPSEATMALNTLSEKAAANKAQAEADAQAKVDFEETMNRIRFQNSLREKSRRAMEQATTKEEKAKAAEAKQKLDLATREERLKGLAFRSQINQARAQKLVQDLEAKKSLNALTIEMTKTRQDLQQKIAEAKGDKLNRDAKFQVDNLKGKLEMLALDIARRQEALKKAEIATKRAEKMANKSPVSRARAAAVGKRYASMSAEDMANAGIKNPVARRETMAMMDGERAKIEQGISETPDPEFRSLLRALFRELENIKNNNADRQKAYEDYLDAAATLGPEYRNKMEDLFDRFATYKFKFEREGNQSPPNNSEQDIPFDIPPEPEPVKGGTAENVLNYSNVFIKSAEGNVDGLKADADRLHKEVSDIVSAAASRYQKKFGNVANDNHFNDGWADLVTADEKKKFSEYRKVQTELAKAELDVNYDKLVAYLPEEYTARRVTATRSYSSPKVQDLYGMEEPSYRIEIHRKSDGEWVGSIDGLYLFAKDVKKFFARLEAGDRPKSIAEMADWAGLKDDKLVKGLSEGTKTDRGQSAVSRMSQNEQDIPF